ncbi:ABC transporter substrate binding protein [Paraherbaspirillum soli]|uniref:ABC transporter substrate binding protein n=1 Tax=Paraherbaspirillum soli TaxID=631222 RepID=A0ABW0ME25_9BURK
MNRRLGICYRFGLPAALRIEFGLFLLLLCALAYAGEDSAHADPGKRARTVKSRSPDLNGSAAETRLALNELNPIVLAGLDAPPKRAEIPDSKAALAVIYPDLPEPYRSIFAKIIEGIEEQTKTKVSSYPIGPNSNLADLSGQLKRGGTKVVIALGRQGLKAASGLERDISVVVGGVLSVPEGDSRNLTGISLTPDPALLFALLKKLLPGAKKVTVIYDPQHNEWLLKLAREAAKALGLELVVHEAHDLASAARLYEAAFAGADSRLDAVWLPQDATTVDEETILPLVLKESWNRGVPVFSSSFLHVKKGALFALYPNNLGLGHDLASTALSVLAGDSRKHGLSPLREVLTAINLRTASHVGLNIDYQQQRSFDFVFPEP